MHAYRIIALDNSYSSATLSLICDDFYHRSPLHQAVGITASEFREYMTQQWARTITSGPLKSLVAIDEQTDQVLGCLITDSFPQSFEHTEALPYKRAAIARLLQSLQQQYLNNNPFPDKALLVDMAVVSTSAGKRGIYQALRTTLHEHASAAGFNQVFGELSSAVTQKICVEKFGHDVVGEISYRDFSYNNRYPFASIDDPLTIQLVAGDPGR